MSKLSFRIQPRETGLRAIASPYPDTQIKLDGQHIGDITAPSRFGDSKWRVAIYADKSDFASSPEDPCPWERLTFKQRFDTEAEARDWFKRVAWPVVLERYTFVQFVQDI